MKVLWLCNVFFSEEKIVSNGSWLQPLAEALQQRDSIELVNVTLMDVKAVTKFNGTNIDQWIIPLNKNLISNSIASKKTCERIAKIIAQEKPDLVHIWGTESIWASVYKQGYIKEKTLIDIQGLIFAYSEYYYGGLSFREIFRSIFLKELIMPHRNLFFKKLNFTKRGREEIDCLKSFKYISYQSLWVKNHISLLNRNADKFYTHIMLRKHFYLANPWFFKNLKNSPIIFSSCSAAVTYKGIHVLIKAVSILKRKYPSITLRLAGNINVGNLLRDGYSIFLNRLIDRLGLRDNIIFLGSLDESQIVNELQQSYVCVVPSFVETYCLAFAEAMIIGVPTVVSYAGAMPELAEHGKDALFYNSLDYFTCARYIDELVQNKTLAEYISVNSRKRRMLENDPIRVVNKQIDIYKQILEID